MPLSEYEQRVLEQMERQLTSDDPRLANTLTQRGRRPFGRYVIAGVGCDRRPVAARPGCCEEPGVAGRGRLRDHVRRGGVRLRGPAPRKSPIRPAWRGSERRRRASREEAARGLHEPLRGGAGNGVAATAVAEQQFSTPPTELVDPPREQSAGLDRATAPARSARVSTARASATSAAGASPVSSAPVRVTQLGVEPTATTVRGVSASGPERRPRLASRRRARDQARSGVRSEQQAGAATDDEDQGERGDDQDGTATVIPTGSHALVDCGCTVPPVCGAARAPAPAWSPGRGSALARPPPGSGGRTSSTPDERVAPRRQRTRLDRRRRLEAAPSRSSRSTARARRATACP